MREASVEPARRAPQGRGRRAAGAPVVVCYARQGSRGLVVTQASRAAEEQGVRAGLPLAEARALLKGMPRRRAMAPMLVEHDFEQDRAALRELALEWQRYTPLVGLEEGPHPESLLLELSGCVHLWGDEPTLIRAMQQELAERGWVARIAMAETIGRAWALAHAAAPACTAGLASAVIDGDEALLAELPLASLRLPAKCLAALEKIGLQCLGDVWRLPRNTLPSRFGRELNVRLDQFAGRTPELFSPERLVEPIMADWCADWPLPSQDALLEVCQTLLSEVLAAVHVRGSGVLELRVELKVGHDWQAMELRLSRPTVELAHLLRLLRLRSERMTWSHNVQHVRLAVLRMGVRPQRQASLFEEPEDRHAEAWRRLVEQLHSRLGPKAVLQPQPTPEVLPEQAVAWQPWLEATDRDDEFGSDWESSEERKVRWRHRPLRLFAAPIPIQVEGATLRRDGRTEILARCSLPERVEAGWWDASDQRRDYHQLETTNGRRWWAYQDRTSHQWFLQGAFE